MNKEKIFSFKSEVVNSSYKDISILLKRFSKKPLSVALSETYLFKTPKSSFLYNFLSYLHYMSNDMGLSFPVITQASIETKMVLKRFRVRAKGRIVSYRKKYHRVHISLVEGLS